MNPTKEMLKAGAAKLNDLIKDDCGIADQEAAVQEIWEAMLDVERSYTVEKVRNEYTALLEATRKYSPNPRQPS